MTLPPFEVRWLVPGDEALDVSSPRPSPRPDGAGTVRGPRASHSHRHRVST